MQEKTQDRESLDVVIYDATGRDGNQDPRSEMTAESKIQIAKELSSHGFPYFEAGYPEANHGEMELFRNLSRLNLPMNIVAFGSTREQLKRVDQDRKLKALLDANTGYVTIYGKTWLDHVIKQFQKVQESERPAENLRMISESIDFLKQKGKKVIYDMEHGCWGLKFNQDYALKCMESAMDAGADWIVLCDTKGGVLPFDLRDSILPLIRDNFKGYNRWGFHGHNDSGVATANSLEFVKFIRDNDMGTPMVQGTFFCGERCGNAALPEIIVNLELKMDLRTGIDTTRLTDLCYRIAELTGISVPSNSPFFGEHAFVNNAGGHTDAESKGATYFHIPPGSVGNRGNAVLSDQSGEATAVLFAQNFGYDVDKRTPQSRALIDMIKYMESKGYKLQGRHGENMSGEQYLLVERVLGQQRTYFSEDSFETKTKPKENNDDEASETVIKGFFSKDGTDDNFKEYHDVASSQHGPVSSQFRALKKRVGTYHPFVKKIKLERYIPSMIDKEGVDSTMRVYIEFSLQTKNGEERWGTVGVSDDIMQASYESLKKCIEYALIRNEKGEFQIK